jgi:hypothetical protein
VGHKFVFFLKSDFFENDEVFIGWGTNLFFLKKIRFFENDKKQLVFLIQMTIFEFKRKT